MPRSVNHVASRARRKKILKRVKGQFGARKNVWTVAKNAYEKGLQYAYVGRKNKNVNSVLSGFSVSTQQLVLKECHILSSWELSTRLELKSTARHSLTSPSTTHRHSRPLLKR